MAGQIFLRTLDGKTITLEVSPLATVEELKALVAQREGLDVEEQRLLYKGTPQFWNN